MVNRLSRYNNSEEVVDNIPYCARALNVITDGITSPDDITKKTIQVISKNSQETTDNDIKEIRNLIDRFDLDRLVYICVKQSLKLGDDFLEICDYTKDDVPVTQSFLSEDVSKSKEKELFEGVKGTISWIEKDNITEKETEYKFEVEINLQESSLTAVDEAESSEKKETTPPIELQHLRILQHNAKNVIKLQSRVNRMCIGYLVLPSVGAEGINNSTPTSIGKMSVNQNRTPTSNATPQFIPYYCDNMHGVDDLYKTLFSKIKDLMSKNKITIDNKVTKEIIARIIRDMGLNDQYSDDGNTLKIEIRFVPENRMIHWHTENNRYFPYGESIFDKIMFQAKLLIALETAATTKRLSESTEKRIVYYETQLPRDGRNIVNDIKGEMQKRRHGIASLGNISSIPSMIQTYSTFYIPQTKGKRFIEFDRLEPVPEIRGVVDELKFFRDQLLSGLDVPPPYLNMEEGISNKNTLAFENSMFAETLIGYQQLFNPHLHELIAKIYKWLKGTDFPNTVSVTFPPPKMLQIERESERMEFIGRLVNAATEMGIPKEWAVKKYLDYPFEEIKQFESGDILDKKMKQDKQEETPMDQGGYGAGGF